MPASAPPPPPPRRCRRRRAHREQPGLHSDSDRAALGLNARRPPGRRGRRSAARPPAAQVPYSKALARAGERRDEGLEAYYREQQAQVL